MDFRQKIIMSVEVCQETFSRTDLRSITRDQLRKYTESPALDRSDEDLASSKVNEQFKLFRSF